MSRLPDFSFLQVLTLALLDCSEDNDFTAGANTGEFEVPIAGRSSLAGNRTVCARRLKIPERREILSGGSG